MKNRQFEHTGWFHPSKSFETDMKNWSVEYTGPFHPKVLNQTLSTYKLNIQGGSIQKFWTRHKVLTSWTYKKIPFKILNQTWSTDKLNIRWFNPKLLNQISSRQAEHTGCFHPKVLNQTWRTDNLNIQGDSIQNIWARHEVLTTWTYRVIPSKFWTRQVEHTRWFHPSFEPDMKNRQVEYTGWFHPKVLSQIWSTDKLNIQGDSIQVLNQAWSTDKLNIQEDSIRKFWTRQVEHTRWFHPSFEPDMKNRQVEYKGWFHPKVLNQTWSTDKLNIKGDSIQTFWTRQVLTNWTYRKIQSKSLESDKKNKQVEHTWWFHPKVLNQTLSTDKLNIQEDSIQKFGIGQEEQTSWTYRVISSKSFEPDIKYWQIEHTGRFNPKVWNRTRRTNKLNIQGDFIQKFWTRYEVLTSWTYRVILSKCFEPDMKYWQIEHTKAIPSKSFEPDMKYLQKTN